MKRLLLLTFLCSLLASAQTSPYHRFGQVLTRGSGVSVGVVPYANINVCVGGSSPCTAASIYYNVGLTSPITGPVVADSSGNFTYYMAGNQCVDEYYSAPGIAAYEIPNVCSSFVNNNIGTSTNGQILTNSSGAVAGINPSTLVSTVQSGSQSLTSSLVAPAFTGNLTGNVTGLASLNLPLTGGTLTGPLVSTALNGIINGATNVSSDDAVRLNTCLVAAESSPTLTCDFRDAGTSLNFQSNAFAGITASGLHVLLPPTASVNVSVTQVIIAPYMNLDFGRYTYPLQWKWTGASGGTVLDVKDASYLLVEGLAIDCQGTGAHGILMSGGVKNVFNDVFQNIEVVNCNYGGFGANAPGIDNATITSFGVTMARTGGTVTGVVTGGAFPANWVGQTMGEVAISGASDSTYNYALTEGAPFTTPSCSISSTTAFSCPAPGGDSNSWDPNVTSGVTATLSSYAGMQDWYCYSCLIYTNEEGYATRWPFARFIGGIISFSGTEAYEAFLTGGAIFSGTTFSTNQTDWYIAGNNTWSSADLSWFEDGNTSGRGILQMASGVKDFTVSITGSSIHTNSNNDLIDYSAASGSGSGTITLSGNYLAATSFSFAILGNSNTNMTVNSWGWSSWGHIPSYTNVPLGPFLAGNSSFGLIGTADQIQINASGVYPAHRGVMIGPSASDGGLYSIVDCTLPSPLWYWNTNLGATKASLDCSGNLNITGQYKISGAQISFNNIAGTINAPQLPATVPLVGTPTLNHTLCAKSVTSSVYTLGFCSTAVASDGTCTCN